VVVALAGHRVSSQVMLPEVQVRKGLPEWRRIWPTPPDHPRHQEVEHWTHPGSGRDDRAFLLRGVRFLVGERRESARSSTSGPACPHRATCTRWRTTPTRRCASSTSTSTSTRDRARPRPRPRNLEALAVGPLRPPRRRRSGRVSRARESSRPCCRPAPPGRCHAAIGVIARLLHPQGRPVASAARTRCSGDRTP
jgi:hypothetical protein